MTYPVLYTAEVWDEITRKMETVKGITFADLQIILPKQQNELKAITD